MRLDLATFVTQPSGHLSDDDIVVSLRSSGPDLSAEQARDVEEVMISTSSAKIRNAAALALVDANYPDLQVAINKVLRRPGVASSAGTLLFCLLETNSRVEVAAIPSLVRDGSYEARSELLMLTSEGMITMGHDAEMDTVQSELQSIASSLDAAASEVARLAIQDLEALRRA